MFTFSFHLLSYVPQASQFTKTSTSPCGKNKKKSREISAYFCGLLRIYITFNFTFFLDRHWKFLVTVQHYDENTQKFTPICVGSIIGKNWVLTVQSCVMKILNLDHLYVLSNSTHSTFEMSKFKSIHRVEEIIPHKDMVKSIFFQIAFSKL